MFHDLDCTFPAFKQHSEVVIISERARRFVRLNHLAFRLKTGTASFFQRESNNVPIMS
jgi:hypothetical protein